jgi:hypothetical protein
MVRGIDFAIFPVLDLPKRELVRLQSSGGRMLVRLQGLRTQAHKRLNRIAVQLNKKDDKSTRCYAHTVISENDRYSHQPC